MATHFYLLKMIYKYNSKPNMMIYFLSQLMILDIWL